MPGFPPFPPLPEKPQDPFAALLGGFGRGLGTVNQALQSMEYQSALQREREAREALRKYGQTGDISVLQKVDPVTALKIRTQQAAIGESEAKTIKERLNAAKEYLTTVVPFLSKENIREFYNNLETRFGISTKGWPIPKTDEEFRDIYGKLVTIVNKIKSGAGYVVIRERPDGTIEPIMITEHKPFLVGKEKGSPKLYWNRQTGQRQYFVPGKEPPGWEPYTKELVEMEIAPDPLSKEAMSKAIDYIKADSKLSEEFYGYLQSGDIASARKLLTIVANTISGAYGQVPSKAESFRKKVGAVGGTGGARRAPNKIKVGNEEYVPTGRVDARGFPVYRSVQSGKEVAVNLGGSHTYEGTEIPITE